MVRRLGIGLFPLAVIPNIAFGACDKGQLQFLQSSGYTVAEAMAWCQGSTNSAQGAAQVSTGQPSVPRAGPSTDAIPAAATSTSNSTLRTAPLSSSTTVTPISTQDNKGVAVTTDTPTVKDTKVYAGDASFVEEKIFTQSKVGGFRLDDGTINAPTFVAPEHIFFKVTRIETSASGDVLHGIFLTDIDTPSADLDGTDSPRFVSVTTTGADPQAYKIDRTKPYKIARGDLLTSPIIAGGWTYGLLAAPYKFHFKDRSFSSATTLGPYFGRETLSGSTTRKLIGSVGITSVPVVTSDGKTTTTTNRTALSFSVGYLFDIGKNFEAGFLLGVDTAGPRSGYQYNGKPWVALDLGYKFSN